MDQHDSRMDARPGPDGPSDGGRTRRPTDRRDDARIERLSAYLDGWVTDGERAEVERDLAGDAAVREALGDLRLVRTALANLAPPRAPRSFALTAAPERRPFALFRRLEWATRGAAGLAALAFAFALVNGPQASETITSAVPAAARESAPAPAPAAPAPATTAKARETATQTLDIAPGGVALGPTAPVTDAGAGAAAGAPTAAPAGVPTAGTTSAPAPQPAAALNPTSVAPAPAGAPSPSPAPAPGSEATPTAAAAPRTLLAAPAPSATPGDAASAAASATAPTVEATRLGAQQPAAPVPATTPAVAAPASSIPTATPADTAAGAASAPAVPAPGTLTPVSASEDAGAASVAPALGVLALLLVLLAIIQRVGPRPSRA